MADKNCGNCAWWGQFVNFSRIGRCCYTPIPASALVEPGTDLLMDKYDGADCPCHKPKEGEK